MNQNYNEFSTAAHAAALLAEAEERVSGQHAVSRVVLRQFQAEQVGKRIGVYNIRHQSSRTIGLSRAGLVPDLIRVGSFSAESVWSRVENRLGDAIADVAEVGSHADPLNVFRLFNAVALHFARGKVTIETLDTLWTKRGDQLVSGIVDRNRVLLETHFERKIGRPSSQGELEQMVRQYTQSGTHLNETGAWTRARVEEVFADVRDVSRFAHDMYLLRAPEGAQFVISDSPATTYRSAPPESVGGSRVGWAAAHQIAMPFSPALAVLLQPRRSRHPSNSMRVREVPLDARNVRVLNQRQMNSAVDYVFYHPSQPNWRPLGPDAGVMS